MIVVSNASPLISLAKIDQLSLLHDLFSEVFITEEVHRETGASEKAGAFEILKAPWLVVKPLSEPLLLSKWRAMYPLGSGELSTIILAREQKAGLIIIDERKARKLAAEHDLSVVGTLGLLEEVYRKKLITDLTSIYRRLLDTGTFVDRRLLDKSLSSFQLPPL